jgi:hypothetical protein
MHNSYFINVNGQRQNYSSSNKRLAIEDARNWLKGMALADRSEVVDRFGKVAASFQLTAAGVKRLDASDTLTF